MGEKGPIGGVEHLYVVERVYRHGQLLAVIGVAGVYGDVPDATLTLQDDVHRPDVAPRLADGR
jgi:hypothetical protein